MKGDRKQIVANGLMISSLLFLGGFLVLFIISSYKKEKENLQKEVGYLFVNSIRSIEGGILNKMVLQEDSSLMNRIHFPRMKKDFLVKSVINIEDHKALTKDGTLQIKVRHEAKSSDIKGSVAMFIALSGDSTDINDSCTSLRSDGEFLNELQTNFRKNIEAANLPISYSIKKEREDTVHEDSDLATGSYTDISSGERYLVNIENYGFLIYKKILPEFIFSLLLFVCVALAFYLVYKTLASEKMLMNLKNDFIQNITHELKTPIATVSVALEAMQDFNVLDDRHMRSEYLNISKSELKRLSLLVDKVLNISQVEKELPSIQFTQLDLKPVIGEILDTLKLQFEKLNIEVNFECVGEDFFILGDKQRVDGLLYNLLDNAMKYNNSTQPIIDIQLTHLDKQVKLLVSDNGIGIPEEHQKNVFEKFYRVPQGDIHNVKGHGLGLSFVAQVVAEMGGEIKLESHQTVGSTFIIQFPFHPNS